MKWSVEFLDDRVRAALEELPLDIQARFLRIVRLIESAGCRVVVVHVFVKKTRKTPRREIETAQRRAKEVQ